MEDCRCNKYDKPKDLLLDIFIVSSHLKLLTCVKCGGLMGEWTDKIAPNKKIVFKKRTGTLKIILKVISN
jgi:hypothetical protein